MTDSSWQQAVLRDIGFSQRGLQTSDEAPTGVAPPSWGADAPRPAPRPAPAQDAPGPAGAQPYSSPPAGPAQPATPQPPAPQPAPQPAAQPAPQPAAAPPADARPASADPSSQATQQPPQAHPEPDPRPAPVPAAPETPDQQASQQPPHDAPRQQDAPQQQDATQPGTPQQEAPVPQEAPRQDAPQQNAAQQDAAAAQAPPQPDAAPQPPEPAQQPQGQEPSAQQGADVPAEPQQADLLVHSEFDWEAAVNPVLGAVPTADQSGRDGAEPGDAASGGSAPPAHGQQPAPGQAVPGQGVPGQAGDAHQIPADDLVRKNQHGDPLARRLGRGVRNAMGGGAREARERAAFAELMQRSVPSSRQIAVASVRGGAGKTTMAAMLATELALHRADRVLAADADAELGSLPLRLGVRPQMSLFELAAANPATFEEVERYLARTPQGLYVLSSTRGGRIAGEFTLETFQTALSSVSRYVAATVVDCGAGILTEVNRGVVAGSHGLVLVTPGTVDGALSARGALEWYSANDQGGLLGRTVIAMVSHAPQVGADLQRAQQMLAAWGLPVVFVPYDRHLATGSSVELSKVSAAARSAFTRIVHEVFSRSLAAGGVH